MVKAGQINRCQELDKLEAYVVALHVQLSVMIFYSIALQKTLVLFWNGIGYVKKHKFSNAVFTTIHKPTFFPSTLQMEALRAMSAEMASYICI